MRAWGNHSNSRLHGSSREQTEWCRSKYPHLHCGVICFVFLQMIYFYSQDVEGEEHNTNRMLLENYSISVVIVLVTSGLLSWHLSVNFVRSFGAFFPPHIERFSPRATQLIMLLGGSKNSTKHYKMSYCRLGSKDGTLYHSLLSFFYWYLSTKRCS